MPIKVNRDKHYAYVLRRRKGKTFAAVFEMALDDRQIESRIRQGQVVFFPFNPRTKQVRWDQGKPLRFKR